MKMTNWINQAKSSLGSKTYHSNALSAVAREQEMNRVIKFTLCASMASLVALEPSVALATTATDNLTTAASNILGLFTGTLGKAVATIAVVVMGMMAMFGKLEWERAFKVILGIAIVFGASAFVKLISGATTINSI